MVRCIPMAPSKLHSSRLVIINIIFCGYPYSVDGRAYIHCCDCESTNLSFGLFSLTTGDVFSFQSSIMILSLVNR